MKREELIEALMTIKDLKVYSPTLHKLTLEILGERYVFLVSLKIGKVKLIKVERCK